MKKIVISIIFTCLCLPALAQGEALHEDGHIERIPRWELENGVWEKYRRGDYNNLWLGYGSVGQREGYVLARTKIDEHRHELGEHRAIPVFVFHHHTLFDGCVISPETYEKLRAIAPGEMVRVTSPVIVIEYETEDFQEFKDAILPLRPARAENFFIWVHRTGKKRRDVVRIIDTADPEDFGKYYWEVDYKTYMTLFGEGRRKKK